MGLGFGWSRSSEMKRSFITFWESIRNWEPPIAALASTSLASKKLRFVKLKSLVFGACASLSILILNHKIF